MPTVLLDIPDKMKKSPNKKGMEQETIMMIILGLLIFALFLVLVYIIVNAQKEEGDIRQCKYSVLENANARLKIKGTDLSSYQGKIAKINCETEYKTITTDDENAMKRTVAASIATCWDIYGKDGYELFDTRDGNYCVVCSRLEFKKPKTLGNFSKYLRETAFREDMTYFEFLNKRKPTPGNEVSDPTLARYDIINTDKPVGIVFMMAKNSHFGKLATGLGGVTAGTAVSVVGVVLTGTGVLSWVGIPTIIAGAALGGYGGYVLGSDVSSNFKSRIVVFPYDDLKSLNCTRLEGKSNSGELSVTE